MPTLSPLDSSLSTPFLVSRLLGRFHFLGDTRNGHSHFYILCFPTHGNSPVKIDADTRKVLVGNCISFLLVNELGTIVGTLFDSEANKTRITSRFATVVNIPCHDPLKRKVDTQADGTRVKQVVESAYFGCLAYIEQHRNLCLVSTIFDEFPFADMDNL